MSCIIGFNSLYNSGNTQPTTDAIPMFHGMAELDGILFNSLEDEAPKERFVDEVNGRITRITCRTG